MAVDGSTSSTVKLDVGRCVEEDYQYLNFLAEGISDT